MTELLVETATEVCSVAVARDGRLLSEVTATEVHQHASHLTRFIRAAVDQAGIRLDRLDEIVLSDGPGSYTSLRVGAATVKGLCLALPGVTFSTVSTLDALAAAASLPRQRVLATIRSRRGEVFGRVYDENTRPLTDVLNVRLTDPRWRGQLLNGEGLGKIRVCGPGRERIREAVPDDNAFTYGGPETCAARYLLAPARRRPELASYEPFYLNPPFVTRTKKRSLL
jgi:tRNA threonylcarbamoyladenosine biosynthesis protein TsaB